jgi:two-component system, OmpR family, response regulator MprA
MRLLVAEDERALRQALRRALNLEGYEVHLASDGDEALAQLARCVPDAVILDVLMPGQDGIEVCRRMRSSGDRTPVLMLTARDRIAHRVAGLDAGADDYLVKPFELDELLARVRALLRRSIGHDGMEPLRFRHLRLDVDAHGAWVGERLIELTRTEFLLLELLLLNVERVLPRSLIYERVWGHDLGASSNSLGVYIGYLRRKLEAGGEPRLIHTVQGVGYTLRER